MVGADGQNKNVGFNRMVQGVLQNMIVRKQFKVVFDLKNNFPHS